MNCNTIPVEWLIPFTVIRKYAKYLLRALPAEAQHKQNESSWNIISVHVNQVRIRGEEWDSAGTGFPSLKAAWRTEAGLWGHAAWCCSAAGSASLPGKRKSARGTCWVDRGPQEGGLSPPLQTLVHFPRPWEVSLVNLQRFRMEVSQGDWSMCELWGVSQGCPIALL